MLFYQILWCRLIHVANATQWNKAWVLLLWDDFIRLTYKIHWRWLGHDTMPLCLTISLISCRVDVAVAIAFALVFCMLVVISCTTLYFRRFWIFLLVVSFSIILLIRLRASRQTLARKRERRLPLSIWAFFVVISHRMYTGRQRIDISYIINLVFHEYLSAVITSVGQK